MDLERIELSFPGCKPGVFPLDDKPINLTGADPVGDDEITNRITIG